MGVVSVVTTPMITNIEKISKSINSDLYAILAITSSIIPLAFNPIPIVNETLLLYPAILLPKKAPAIFEK